MPFKIGLAQKRKQLIAEELKRVIPKIIELDVEKVIVFGSSVSNTVHKSSDLDILIIKKTSKKFLDRLEEFYQHLKPRLAMDIFVYTPEEFEDMKRSNQLVKSALKNREVLYEK
ncbi:MAG: nucleotidyltransferase domain-containing protein [Candidatus Lokiarchaeia archaeon]